MKILSSSQTREADAFTIANEPVNSIDLMERAAGAFTDWFMRHFDNSRPVKVLCGQGNNGGDGLAVSRMLSHARYDIKVYVLCLKEKGTADFEINRQRLSAMTNIKNIAGNEGIPDFGSKDIIIDALFGSGLSRPVEGLSAAVIEAMNKAGTGTTRVAIDIASGMLSDQHSVGKTIIKANHTVSFQLPKLAFLMPENEEHVGEWTVVNIGLNQKFLQAISTPYHYLIQPFIASLLKRRKKFSHKGDFGHSLIISGSKGKIGATVLCSRACLKAGAGLVTVFAPGCGYDILQTSVPEAMIISDEMDAYLSSVPETDKFDVMGVGPGIGTHEQTVASLRLILEKAAGPMVIDADALNILGQHKELLTKIPPNSILTPHPKEFERIAGNFKDDFERLALQKDFAKKHNVYLLVKGAHTSIATPEGEVYFNSTGNPGMAKGGSGDVLTGMLAALLGQQYSPVEAVLLGVYMHGLAADKAAEKIALESITASDIINHISDALLSIRHEEEI